MNKQDNSQAILKEASKHCPWLTYRATPPGGRREEAKLHYASCFVIEVENQWILVTAGHVLNRIKTAVAGGYVVSDAYLHDKLAGNSFPIGVPFSLDIDQWVIIDGNVPSGDFAATPLSPLFVENLRVGGIAPIDESAWGNPLNEEYSDWLLFGIPSETHAEVGGKVQLKPTLMVLRRTERPPEAWNLSDDMLFAELVSQKDDRVAVDDIEGMSGGPIFGLKVVDGRFRYWVIGVQSSWFKSSRIICFYPPLAFFTAIKEAIRRFEDTHRTYTYIQH